MLLNISCIVNLDLKQGVGCALGRIKDVFLHLREIESSDFGVIGEDELALEFSLIGEDRDETGFAAVVEIVAGNVEFPRLGVQGKGSRSKAP